MKHEIRNAYDIEKIQFDLAVRQVSLDRWKTPEEPTPRELYGRVFTIGPLDKLLPQTKPRRGRWRRVCPIRPVQRILVGKTI